MHHGAHCVSTGIATDAIQVAGHMHTDLPPLYQNAADTAPRGSAAAPYQSHAILSCPEHLVPMRHGEAHCSSNVLTSEKHSFSLLACCKLQHSTRMLLTETGS